MDMSYKEWSKKVGDKLRAKPQMKTKITNKMFQRMYKDNYSPEDAFRIAYLNI